LGRDCSEPEERGGYSFPLFLWTPPVVLGWLVLYMCNFIKFKLTITSGGFCDPRFTAEENKAKQVLKTARGSLVSE
jgi:hypothetical protein